MNTRILTIAIALLVCISFLSCEADNAIDTQKPVIDNSFSEAFPKSCDTLYFGETFEFRMQFSDNVELGSFNISMHNNFDHHSHSTEIETCIFDPVKDPINPLVFIEDYDIPIGQTEYSTNLSLSLPFGAGNEGHDEGDYHCYITLTDKEGWSIQKGFSVKILHR